VGGKNDREDAPMAVWIAVRLQALTIALTAPVSSSSTKVVAGNPRVSEEEVGTETTLRAVPNGERRAGMQRAVCPAVGTDIR
jgi:hypothetical protein